ncbi:MAG: hypothetical protein E6G67_00245 [Actinobacteria bacterium]|nr:MAG: hypothetical protein E6G67_00245 [Actinomycetota bacterium]
MATEVQRPSFYALEAGGWRDYVTLLHLPYTAWHLSYVAIGAALAPSLPLSRFLPTLAAFFLGLGIGAHALDELNGRPLRTRIPDRVLVVLAVASLAGAVAIGIVGALTRDPWIFAFVGAGAFAAVAYNLELFGGRFHGDAWFALFWGSFPVLTGYFAVAGTIRIEAVAACVFAFALSLAQRRLSTPVRDVRRRVRRVQGRIERSDGTAQKVDTDVLVGPAEGALRALTVATVALALALVVLRLG